MLSFASDYIAGAHPKILERLSETNFENLSGYGTDKYTLSAASKIKEACGNKDADVYFIAGGTQTNQFIVLENAKMEALGKEVEFGFWEKYDDTHTVVRFATSWSTTPEDIEALSKLI